MVQYIYRKLLTPPDGGLLLYMATAQIGSAGSISGSNDALQAAIGRRQGGESTPLLDQSGTQSINPSPQPSVPSPEGQAISPVPPQIEESEAMFLVKALAERLKTLGAVEKFQGGGGAEKVQLDGAKLAMGGGSI